MTVLVLERVTPSVRGDLSRWLVEIVPGVFVGRVTPLVREALWERAVARAGDGSALALWDAPSEQGFDLRAHQVKGRQPVDYDGVWLLERIGEAPPDGPPEGEEAADASPASDEAAVLSGLDAGDPVPASLPASADAPSARSDLPDDASAR